MLFERDRILEGFFLILLVGLLLYSGLAVIWDNKIEHPYPWGYYATDAFQHQTRAQWIKDQGNYLLEAPYYSSNLNNIVGFYPPILNHVAVLLSIVSGFEVYDTIQIIIFLCALFGALTMYLIISDFNKKVAILSLPFVLFLFALNGSRVGWLWGHWPSLVGNFFLVAFLWSMIKFEKVKKPYFLIALFLSGAFMAHTVFAIFAILFIVLYFFFTNKKKEYFKTIILSSFICFVATAYFVNIFVNTWLRIQPYHFSIITSLQGFGDVLNLTDFGYSSIFVFAGLLISLFILLKQREKAVFASLFFVLIGFTNYVGFERRAFNLRFFWPITLSFFFGITIYFLIKKYSVLTKKEISLTHFLFLGVFLTISIFYSLSDKYISGGSAGLMNPPVWDTLTWIEKNSPQNSTVFYSYGDFYDQFALVANSKRVAVRMQTEDFVDSLKKNIIKRNYKAWMYSEYGAGLPYKTGTFSFSLKAHEDMSLTSDKETDFCLMNYLVFDKVSRYPELAKYNLLIANKLLNHIQFEIVHQNELSLIIKNNNVEDECIQ